jgi:hypothetical protein
VAAGFLIYALDKGWWEAVLLAVENSDFFHKVVIFIELLGSIEDPRAANEG